MISGDKCDFFLQKSLNSWGFKAIQENGDSVDAVEYICASVDAVEYIFTRTKEMRANFRALFLFLKKNARENMRAFLKKNAHI